MYSLEEPTEFDKANYCSIICKMDVLRSIIDNYVNGQSNIEVELDDLKVNIKVIAGSMTDDFLRGLLQGDNLKKLLCGNVDYLRNVIRSFENERLAKHFSKDDFYYKKLTKRHIENLKGSALQDGETVDIPITILRKIFIDEGYENAGVFNKNEFVKGLDLRVCPYCGRAYIYSVENAYRKGTSHVVKPQIDHFFPKSKYPYLALSYQNLIPVCQTCNSIGAKGDNEPMKGAEYRFPYPYRFNDNDIHFSCLILDSHVFKDENFKIIIRYANAVLEDGCKSILSLNSLYEHHNHEVCGMYSQIMLLTSQAKTYYYNMGIFPEHIIISPQMVLGFLFSKRASRNELLYKFKKDLYEQFTADL